MTFTLQGRDWRFWLGVFLSLICLGWLLFTTDWVATGQLLQTADYTLIISATLLNLATIPMRTARWRLMFPRHNLPTFKKLTLAMLIGQAINVFAPARLGDLVRATLVDTARTAYVLGTQVVQLALDLLMLTGLVIFLLFQVSLPAEWRGSGQALLVTSALALTAVALAILLRHPLLQVVTQLATRWTNRGWQKLLNVAADFLRSLDVLAQPKVMITAVLWSLLIWLGYGLVNLLLLAAVGGFDNPAPTANPLLAALFTLVVLQLGIAIPSSPGRIGVYHYLGIQTLVLLGYWEATAVSFTILLHLISVVLPTLIGAGLAWQVGQLRNHSKP